MVLVLTEEFISPHELELAEFYGGIPYRHSCGDASRFDAFQPVHEQQGILSEIQSWIGITKSVIGAYLRER